MPNLSSNARSDLTFNMPRIYARAIQQAMRDRGLTSLSAYGRLAVLENLRELGYVDEYFRPIVATTVEVAQKEEDAGVRDQQELSLRGSS